MFTINMNNAGGFLLNPNVAADGQPNFLDRSKLIKLPISLIDDNSLENFVWTILLDRENIPDNIEKGELSDEVDALIEILEINGWADLDVHFDEVRIGGDIKLFAKIINMKFNFDTNSSYTGRAIVIKRSA